MIHLLSDGSLAEEIMLEIRVKLVHTSKMSSHQLSDGFYATELRLKIRVKSVKNEFSPVLHTK